MTPKSKPSALLPLVTFLSVYLITSITTGDFYKMPVSVAFLLASGHALIQNRRRKFADKVNDFAKGMGQSDIMMMCLIFILAGAFASIAKSMGAIDATVNMGLSLLPSSMLMAGIFIVACFIAISVGTSVGTIAALTPMAVGIASKIGIDPTIAIGAVVGGAMFGDNLSMISDTTIAATRSQQCELKDKFKANIKIVIPPAIISLVIYILISTGGRAVVTEATDFQLIKVIPYIFVLMAALAGLNVIIVLSLGVILAATIGLSTNAFDFWEMIKSTQTGIENMSELIIITILVGGTVTLIKQNGGVEYIIQMIKRHIHNKRGAEFGIAALTGLVNICTANNTIAIVITGPIVKDISDKYSIEAPRSASLMDTFSCFTQGVIPYGAQILTAVKLSELAISPFQIMEYLYYPYLLGISAILVIIFRGKKINFRNRDLKRS